MAPKTDPWMMMSPELLDLISQAGVLDDQQAINLHNLRQAEQKAATEQPGVRAHGRMLLASSPLEHIAAALKAIQGGQEGNAIQQQMAALLRQKANTTTAAKNWYRNAYQQTAIPEPEPAPSPAGMPWDFAGKLR